MLRLDGPELAEVIRSRQGADEGERAAMQDLDGAEAKLAELAREWAADTITKAEWLVARQAVEARLEASRRVLDRHHRTTAIDSFLGQVGALGGAWPELTLERRRAVIAAVVDTISIGPAVRGINRFDPDRVDVTWKV